MNATTRRCKSVLLTCFRCLPYRYLSGLILHATTIESSGSCNRAAPTQIRVIDDTLSGSWVGLLIAWLLTVNGDIGSNVPGSQNTESPYTSKSTVATAAMTFTEGIHIVISKLYTWEQVLQLNPQHLECFSPGEDQIDIGMNQSCNQHINSLS